MRQSCVIAGLAVVWGVGGLAFFYLGAAWLVGRLPLKWSQRLEPFVFVGPGILAVLYFLALPTVRTFIASLFNRDGSVFVGLANYVAVFTEPFMLVTFRNNLMWLVFGAGLTVILGLLVATLADRSRHEWLVKAIIFMPMAISLVGAGVIWKFVYAVKDPSVPQIGLLNAIVVAFGGEPQAWIAQLQPWNNLFLIVIVIWLQTGYAMVLFSAAIKAVPAEMLEAARIDGAGEVRHLLPDRRPHDHGDDHHRQRHGDHLHVEDLRRRDRHDRGQFRHRRHRHPVLQSVFRQPELRSRVDDRHRAPRPCHPGRGLQPPPVPQERGR